MKKYLIIAVVLVILLPIAAIGAALTLPQYINWASYEQKIEAMIKEKSGYTVDIVDGIALSTWPEPFVELGGVRVASFDGDQDIFSSGKMRIDIDFSTLLAFGLGIKNVTLENPDIYLAVNSNSVANWLPKRTKSLRRSSSSDTDLSFIKSLGQVSITNGHFVYEDEVAASRIEVADFGLTIKGDELAKSQLEMQAKINEVPAAMIFDMNLSDFDEIPLKGEASLGLSVVHLDGAIVNPMASAGYTGALSVQGEDLLENVYKIVNIPPSRRSFTFPVHLKTQLSSENGTISVKDLSLALSDGQQLELKGDVVYKAATSRQKAELNVALMSDKPLNLGVLGLCKENASQADHNKEESKGESPWTDDLIDLSALENMKASFKVKTSEISCGTTSIDGLDILANIAKGKATLERFQVKQGEGTIDITGNMNVPAGQKATMDMVINNLPLESFLSPAQAKNVQAPLTGFVKLSFGGKTTKAWASSLVGRIEMKSTDMRLENFALDKLALSTKSIFGQKAQKLVKLSDDTSAEIKAKNASFIAAFDVEDGVMKTDTFALTTGEGTLTGEGKVDLVNWKVNYKLIPSTKSKLGVSLPILVRGNLSSPLIAPDLTSSQGLGAGVGAVLGGPIGAGVGAAVGNALAGHKADKNAEKEDEKGSLEEGVKGILNLFNKK